MTEPSSRADRALWIAVAVLVGLLFAFMAWQYVMPVELRSTFNLNHPGVDQFRRQYRIAVAPQALDRYTLGFRAFIGAIWLAYFVVLAACFEGGRLSRRATFIVVAVSPLAMAVLWPLSFSGDVYSYVGYARLATDHHANPYFADRTILRAVDDPTAGFMAPLLSSPYGPLWNLLSIALVWSTRALGLFGQLLAFKLVAAAALVALAWTVRTLAEQGEPRRGDAAALAVGLNPLLMIEGPGNGHNDVLMMALVLGGVLALSRRRPRLGALLIGAAAAIKYLPLVLVPWVAVAAAVAEASARRRVVAVLAVGALALAPDRARVRPVLARAGDARRPGPAVVRGAGRHRWAGAAGLDDERRRPGRLHRDVRVGHGPAGGGPDRRGLDLPGDHAVLHRDRHALSLVPGLELARDLRALARPHARHGRAADDGQLALDARLLDRRKGSPSVADAAGRPVNASSLAPPRRPGPPSR